MKHSMIEQIFVQREAYTLHDLRFLWYIAYKEVLQKYVCTTFPIQIIPRS